MTHNKYKCAHCHGVFRKGWSDEEAIRECVATFAQKPDEFESCVLCDDCYKLIMAAMHDETKN